MYNAVYDYFGGWFWPITIVGILVLTHAGRKCYIVSLGSFYLVTSADKKFDTLKNYEIGHIDERDIRRKHKKTLILIRHGESAWNEVFNRGINWKLPFRFLYACAREAMLFVTSDSCLYDSPLCTVGVSQAQRLQEFLKKGYMPTTNDKAATNSEQVTTNVVSMENSPHLQRYIRILQGREGNKTSQIISSPLRRCIETVSLGLYSRLNKTKEKITVLSSLQEMTRNVDGVSLSGSNEMPPISWTMRTLEKQYNTDWEQWLSDRLDVSQKEGFKSPHRRGDDRMRAFVQWLFTKAQSDVIIISGHSLWFRNFFVGYLPNNLDHCGKSEKIRNGGVVACDFIKYELKTGITRCGIDPQSICEISGGFENKKRKKRFKLF